MAEFLCSASQFNGSLSVLVNYSKIYKTCASHILKNSRSGHSSYDSSSRSRARPGRDGSTSQCHSASEDCFGSRSSSGFNRSLRFLSTSEMSESRSPHLVSAMGRKVVPSPPADFDFRAETREDTMAVVSTSYPALMDLVEDGTLLVVKRAEEYVERRAKDYREPEIVFVVGTAHMSLVSAMQVERVVKTVRPENVVVELCRSRAGMMYDNTSTASNVANESMPVLRPQNIMSLSGENFGAAITRTLRLGGRSALALRLLLGGMSQKISKSAGVATGAESYFLRRLPTVESRGWVTAGGFTNPCEHYVNPVGRMKSEQLGVNTGRWGLEVLGVD